MIGHYAVMEERRGGQNIVFKVKKINSHYAAKKYASKKLMETETVMLKTVLQKVDKETAHLFIQLVDDCLHQDMINIFEWFDFTLDDNVKHSKSKDGLRTTLQYVLRTSILPALAFLHKNKIIHCDIKGGNIMGVLTDSFGHIESRKDW